MACAVPQKCSQRLRLLVRIYLIPLPILFAAATALCVWLWGIPSAIPFAALTAGGIWAIISLPGLYFDSLWYTRHRDWMKIERGVLWRRMILIPRGQIQYVTMRCNPLEKLLGLNTLIFMTSGGRVHLEGLTTQDAARMRELIEGDTAREAAV